MGARRTGTGPQPAVRERERYISMTVTLNVPDEIRFQLVYRMERDAPFRVGLGSELQFVYLDSAIRGLRRLGALKTCFGIAGATKALAKLASSRRSMYTILREGTPVSYGWCMRGSCKQYKIESDAVVIGPIWTHPAERGKGLATKGLQLAIDEHVKRGIRLFYIDTEKLNLPAQRVFEKCGFGAPVALYFR
jgi:GNAT superfamily N-acetyltransferase